MNVKELIIELNKFPMDAECYAYEGEVTGITIDKGKQFGFIYANGDTYHRTYKKPETELFEEEKNER